MKTALVKEEAQNGVDLDNQELNKPKTTLISRNITVLGHRTSIRLEPEMWRAFKEISIRENCTIHDLCALVSIRKNPETSLTAAIRVFIMLYFRSAATEEGHARVGHGNFELMKKRAQISEKLLTFFSKSRRGQYANVA